MNDLKATLSCPYCKHHNLVEIHAHVDSASFIHKCDNMAEDVNGKTCSKSFAVFWEKTFVNHVNKTTVTIDFKTLGTMVNMLSKMHPVI